MAASAPAPPATRRLTKRAAYLFSFQQGRRSRHATLSALSEDKSVTRVSRDPGTHDVVISPDESAFVDAFSTAMKPPSQDLDRIDGSRIAAINENTVPELADYHLSPIEFLNVSADDGTKLYAEIIKPPNFDASRKYPVLINVYGGPQVQNVRNEWGGTDFLWLEMMAEKGFIIFTLDNRGSYGRGHAFETPFITSSAKSSSRINLPA